MALLYILLSLLLCFSSTSFATTVPPKPHALLLKVTKDPSTSQYITEIKQRTPLVPVKLTIDLGADQVWVNAKGYISSTYKPVHCNSSLCKTIKPRLDCNLCQTTAQPGCNNNSCSTFYTNTVSRFSGGGEVAKDAFSIQSTDGSNPGNYVNFPRLVLTCSLTDILIGLAKGVKGMAGFSKNPNSLSSQLTHAFRLTRIWSLCLGSTSGFAVIGDGPYNVLPGIDLSQLLTYTPLVSTPADWNAFLYYIGVTGIKVNNKHVPVNTTILKHSEGRGGTTFNTVALYTVLESSIYKAVRDAFVNALSEVKRVKAVAPFEVCYKSSSFGSTLLGPGVPTIELVLHKENVSWKFFGLNSMVLVNGKKSLCLGFVDGGVSVENSIVIGAHQLENAFLKFDLSRSRLGFASTIIGRRTTCSNFNFTSNV